MKKIYIVRHGDVCEDGEERFWAGVKKDVGLSSKGKIQSAQLTKALPSSDCVIISPML